MKKKRVLFLCTHNAARSHMAEGWLRVMSGDRFEATSAGVEATQVHLLAITVMAEIGIDISGQTSKQVKPYIGQPWSYVITVCDSAHERCPLFPFVTNYRRWECPDRSQATGTAEERLRVFRRVRDEITARMRTWLAEEAPDRCRHRWPVSSTERPEMRYRKLQNDITALGKNSQMS